MNWMIVLGISAVVAAYLFGKSDGEKDGFVDGMSFSEDKRNREKWMQAMFPQNKDDDDEE